MSTGTKDSRDTSVRRQVGARSLARLAFVAILTFVGGEGRDQCASSAPWSHYGTVSKKPCRCRSSNAATESHRSKTGLPRIAQPVHVGSRWLRKAATTPTEEDRASRKNRRTESSDRLLPVADEKRTYILLLFFISCFYVLYMRIDVYSFDKLVWTVMLCSSLLFSSAVFESSELVLGNLQTALCRFGVHILENDPKTQRTVVTFIFRASNENPLPWVRAARLHVLYVISWICKEMLHTDVP